MHIGIFQGENVSERFYTDLPSYTLFEHSASAQNYTPLPDDWYVIITDVTGSTKAIEAGRYKEVNAVAVASIVALINSCKPTDIPFVFGGDGVTACIPASLIDAAKPALAASRKMAREQFGLELRIGMVAVSEVRAQGQDILVAKFEATSDYVQAMFMGKGVNLAESMVKDPASDKHVSITDEMAGDTSLFEGFECRWNSIPTPSEENVSLLIEARTDDPEEEFRILEEIIGHIDACYDDPSLYRPVREHLLSLTGSSRLLKVESLVRTAFAHGQHWWSYLMKLMFVRYIGKALMGLSIKTKETDWGRYKYHFVQNSDFRKLDGTLRMIIAGTKAQRESLVEILDAYYQRNAIYYGYFTMSSALVTCIVTRYEKAHIHLLDGSDGGYAMAAKMLKAQ